ncbi:trehalose operon repressor [Alkalicella caledoniensis]|uniref:Trehalose operon repressor n=1 Tax=Alkalicella caledoniensis TaxID=2731377 RepID=A0A7G9WA00_ALKCA|nr:trehalose operon repressor [Alkalicella caledoniensis]QNO15512.1 trehalose operon repressor [Alkalicella caledoniensis]
MDSKYFKIYNDITVKIEKKEITPNTKLPSENEMMTLYDVSRDTVRKALNMLESNGFIQKIKGKGSFVLDINRFDFPVSGLTSFKELAEKLGQKSNTHVKELELISPDDYLMRHLKLSPEDEVWKVIRVREIGNRKIILDKDYFNKKYVPELTKEICEDSIYDYIENELNLSISFAKKEITVQQATSEDKVLLDLKNYDMIVVVKTHVYLEDASLFQYTESRHRPDKFRFVDFARRQH